MMVTKCVVYGAHGCPWTEHALNWFEGKGAKKIIFMDVLKDFKAREEMQKKTGQLAYPIVEIDGDIIYGFDRSKIEKTYANS